MKKLFTLFALLAMFAFASCEENGAENINPNDKTEQPEDGNGDTENPDEGSEDTEKPNDGNEDTEQPEDGNGDTENPDDGSEDTEKPDDAYIALNKEVVTFSPDGESVDIKVYSNYAWELTNNCDWVTTSITSSEASDEGVTVTLSADLSYDNREGTIIFSCGKAKKPLVVSQSLKEVLFADENNTFNIPAEGGNAIIAYQTTVECEVVIPEEAQSWISIAPTETRALVSYSTTLNVAENTTYSARSAIVKVVAVGNNSLVAEYTITQDSKPFYIEYTSTDGKVVTPNNADVFGAHIIHNEYIDGKGYIWFDAPITSIGEWAFCECTSLESITIPESVTSIGMAAFGLCSSLASITIPDSVTSIGWEAFVGCSSLEEFSGNFASEDGRCLIVDGVLYSFAPAGLTEYTIPNNVTSIGKGAFYLCSSLASITIPDSVTSIGEGAFSDCLNLASVTIPDSVTSIGMGAFSYCSSLASVTIPDSVTSIGDGAFGGCDSLASVIIGNGVTSIGNYAFCECSSLESVTIPNSVTEIGEEAFSRCSSLVSITIPEGVEHIGWMAFADSGLTEVTLPSTLTTLEYGAFGVCESLTSVHCKATTPPSVTRYQYDGTTSWDGFIYDTLLTAIYVPEGSVDAYKSAEGWSEFADLIVAEGGTPAAAMAPRKVAPRNFKPQFKGDIAKREPQMAKKPLRKL